MIPAAPTGHLDPDGCGRRLADPCDVEFALNALLETDAPRRSAVAGRLPRGPTVAEVVDAVFDHPGPVPEAAGRRQRARRLLAAYFAIDPPLPATESAGN